MVRLEVEGARKKDACTKEAGPRHRLPTVDECERGTRVPPGRRSGRVRRLLGGPDVVIGCKERKNLEEKEIEIPESTKFPTGD